MVDGSLKERMIQMQDKHTTNETKKPKMCRRCRWYKPYTDYSMIGMCKLSGKDYHVMAGACKNYE